MTERCGARLRGGRGICRLWPAAGRKRCKYHGGAQPRGLPMRNKAAVVAGIAKWRARTRLAIALGLLDRFPQGRKPFIHRRHETLMSDAKSVIAAARQDIDNGDSGRADRLQQLTGKSLDTLDRILDIKVNTRQRRRKQKDGSYKVIEPDHRMLTLQKDVALGILGAQIKVDEAELRGRRADRIAPLLAALLADGGKGEDAS